MDVPPTTPNPADRWRFGVFDFDGRTLELSKNGRSVAVRPQPLKVLALLLSRPGEVVSRDDLQRALWDGETFVDFEQGVNHAIRELRAAFGDTADSPRFIQTLPRRGYRFVAPVERQGTSIESETMDTAFGVRETAVAGTPAPTRSKRTLAGLIVIGAAALGAVVYVGLRTVEGWSSHQTSTLAVRPFAAPADHTLGIGLANAISARLGGQQTLFIRSESWDGGSAGGSWPPGATHALDGEISSNGSTIDVTAHLRDTSGAIVWSERIHVRKDELFDVEDVIAERVVASLRLRLAAAEQERLRRRYTSNGPAYRDYLRGRAALVRYTPEGTQEAIQAFEAALGNDPGYALARAGLAMGSADMYLRFARENDVDRWGQRADEEARAALDLDPNLAEAHLARAAVARKREFDWNATITEGRRALALNPNLDQARFFIAAAYYHNGYMQEALIEVEKGRSVHGLDVVEPVRIEALTALFSGKFTAAQARLEEVSRLSSQAIGDTYLALGDYYTGRGDRARTMLETLVGSRSASTAARAGAALAGILAARGDRPAARTLVDRVIKGAYRDHHVAYSLGAAYAQLGDAALANQWLRTAADTGFPCLLFFEQDPLLEPLRRRPEFSDLLVYVRMRRDNSLSAMTQ
jgi:DNA-binding winged helix-turn-helix (wHTH) protein/tetratricopeptide (TPR) repeat protein